MRPLRVGIVGAGVGGLACAIDLARSGHRVSVLDRLDRPGGKMRGAVANGVAVDTGPTVLTMAGVFEALFRDAGAELGRALRLAPARVLARHSWTGGAALDLVADREENARAIADFASARDAAGYRRFCRDAGRIFRVLDPAMMRAQKPSPLSLARACGIADMRAIDPFRSLAAALAGYFDDPRLRQLFGRYATYVGSSPSRAPATTMLIAHLEQDGVWLVDGGMRALAGAMADLARAHGAEIELGREVAAIGRDADGRCDGLVLAGGERRAFDRVVCTADPAALAARAIAGAPDALAPSMRRRPVARSLSALTWTGSAVATGAALHRHNVFFASDPAREFEALFGQGRVPAEPTVYVCAQDRPAAIAPATAERLLVLVNAPAARPGRQPPPPDADATARMLDRLAAHGLRLEGAADLVLTGPDGFARDHPGSGGALYGGVTHGWRSTFRRPGARSRIRDLYLAGGGVHPGPGVPMAAISGRLAASALMADLASTRPSRGTAIRGGISTRPPRTAPSASP